MAVASVAMLFGARGTSPSVCNSRSLSMSIRKCILSGKALRTKQTDVLPHERSEPGRVPRHGAPHKEHAAFGSGKAQILHFLTLLCSFLVNMFCFRGFRNFDLYFSHCFM